MCICMQFSKKRSFSFSKGYFAKNILSTRTDMNQYSDCMYLSTIYMKVNSVSVCNTLKNLESKPKFILPWGK